MKTTSTILLIFVGVILALLVPSEQSIPTIAPENSLLNVQSNYVMSYFTLNRFTTASYFQIDFSQCDITVNDGQLNISVSLNSSVINSTNVTSSCVSKVCTIRLNRAFNSSTLVETTFGLLRNPRFTASQRITVMVFFNSTSNSTQLISLSSSIYTPMGVMVNSVTQSDYGVGTYDVMYRFNVSFSYIPSNP